MLKRLVEKTEAPTWGLIILIYCGWLALTWHWHALPIWVLIPAGAWLCAWHMSLQHELLHGHPTRSVRLNALLASPPLNLWLPYALYREEHLRHHTDEHLTDPLADPESTYMHPELWARTTRLHRAIHSACTTLAGRVLLGPAWSIAVFWAAQWCAWRRAGRFAWRAWLTHAAGVILVLVWVCGVCGINPLAYFGCAIYPATALMLLRSLAEHRAAAHPEDRTTIVEHAGLLGLLYLNNNLHALHHAQPVIAWFRLPAQWRANRESLLAAHRGPFYRSYGELWAEIAWRQHHAGPHPFPPLIRPLAATPTQHIDITNYFSDPVQRAEKIRWAHDN